MSNVTIGHGTNLPPLLSAVAATGAGASVKPGAKDRSIQISGTFVGTVLIQCSEDDSNWTTVLTATTEGTWQLESSSRHLRANVSVYTSGTITVKASV